VDRPLPLANTKIQDEGSVTMDPPLKRYSHELLGQTRLANTRLAAYQDRLAGTAFQTTLKRSGKLANLSLPPNEKPLGRRASLLPQRPH
jgi:hypothetical protein